MTDHMPDDLSADGKDMRSYTDALRPQHGVVRNVHGEWVLLRHDLVAEAALNDGVFSSAVSKHLQIPNGLDSEEHTAYRAALDGFLTPQALSPFHEHFRRIAADLVAALPRHVALDAVSQFGTRFAVRAQSAWLGWPSHLEDRLVDWVSENHAATRSGERSWMQRVTESFDDLIQSVLAPRRDAHASGTDDVTARLMRTKVDGRPLTDPEIVSILRNWTGGDLGSIAQCVGVLVQYLAAHGAMQNRLRAGISDTEFDAIIDEILRIDAPFLSNRRVTTCPVTIDGVALPQGARVKLNWTSANRDEAVFGDPERMDPDRNGERNLVYGIGKHACPGRWLATLELRIALQELLAATSSVALDRQQPAERAVSPVGGWAKVPVVLA
ncbi:MAG: cytochrome P450 [Rhodocyclaceae bacterium]